MYFRVYHKKSKQPIATFNERTIVDFCINNKESVKNYYFSTGGQKDLMEWEVFAVKHSELFEKKADERDKKEFGEVKDEGEIKVKSRGSRIPFMIVLTALLFASGVAYYLYLEQQKEFEEMTRKSLLASQEKKDAIVEKLEKRAVAESDTKFTAAVPSEKELNETWRSNKEKMGKSLGFDEIKEHMDSYLPDLKECFVKRSKAGDNTLRGMINMKIRVSGDGVVRDVLFTDEKYQATLFGDCIISAMKSKPFKMFKSREQTFSYYWNL
jgi:hypothetical protein